MHILQILISEMYLLLDNYDLYFDMFFHKTVLSIDKDWIKGILQLSVLNECPVTIVTIDLSLFFHYLYGYANQINLV